ncbi:MAG: response regulator [Deltaproteobacteria bacterium]|nr:response regulator [Deltaproteobacteria bacterium]
MHTILVADDSVTIQQAVEIAFGKEPFSVVKAGSAAEAVARAKDARASLVLADHQMPDKSGYELAEALRADPATAQIPVLILTSSAAPYDEVRGRAAGAVGCIQKPFDCQSLLERVRALLGVAASAPGALPVAVPATSAAPVSAAVAATPRPPGFGGPGAGAGFPRPPGTSPGAVPASPFGGGALGAPPTAPRPAVAQPVVATPISAAATSLSRAPTPQPDKGADPFGFGAAMGGAPRPSATNPFTSSSSPLASAAPAVAKVEPSFDISFDDAPARPAPSSVAAAPAPVSSPPVSSVAASSPPRASSFAEAEFLEVADVDIAEITSPSLPPTPTAPMAAAPAPAMARAPTPVASSIAELGRITSKVDLQRLASLDAAGATATRAMETATAVVVDKAASALAVAGGNGAAPSHEVLSAEAREIVERIAWEVVPELAETIIREELQRLLKAR